MKRTASKPLMRGSKHVRINSMGVPTNVGNINAAPLYDPRKARRQVKFTQMSTDSLIHFQHGNFLDSQQSLLSEQRQRFFAETDENNRRNRK